ncbi:hypothetical protein [Oryzifoliimicrobium ureilyticus]|uniref:hypothetical protein n=1 Tax=Oryzifoliimicrobium ureilyticus TaxID=3113724 RepID=UPI003075FF09
MSSTVYDWTLHVTASPTSKAANGVETFKGYTALYFMSSQIVKLPNGTSGSGYEVHATANVTAVPGPEAGAGIGALTLGGMALYLKRRRKDDVAIA